MTSARRYGVRAGDGGPGPFGAGSVLGRAGSKSGDPPAWPQAGYAAPRHCPPCVTGELGSFFGAGASPRPPSRAQHAQTLANACYVEDERVQDRSDDAQARTKRRLSLT